MTFDQWKKELAVALWRVLRVPDGEAYIAATGDECWREMFNDGLSPSDAAYEEAVAAAWSI